MAGHHTAGTPYHFKHGWIPLDHESTPGRSADKIAARAGHAKAAETGIRSADKIAAGQRPRATGDQVEERVNAALAAGKATDRAFTVNHDGHTYTPERAAEQSKLLDDLWNRDGANVPRQREAVIAGGLGGAGKSTVLRGEIDQSHYLTLNPDDVKEEMAKRGMIPKVDGLSPLESAALVHEESSFLTNQLARRAYANGTNVVWDITMSSAGSVQKRIDNLKAEGYKIHATFVDIPVETSVQRAMARWNSGAEKYAAGQGLGGRYVPPRLIRANAVSDASSANRKVFDQLRPQFDSWSLYDNSGSAPRKVGSG